jgi:hypothetical protein
MREFYIIKCFIFEVIFSLILVFNCFNLFDCDQLICSVNIYWVCFSRSLVHACVHIVALYCISCSSNVLVGMRASVRVRVWVLSVVGQLLRSSTCFIVLSALILWLEVFVRDSAWLCVYMHERVRPCVRLVGSILRLVGGLSRA